MTADVELLPLPETVADWLRYTQVSSGNDGSMETLLRWFEDYARANVEHHTEALRAEAIRTEAELHQQAEQAEQAEARAERLAEALRLAEEHINELTPSWYSEGQRVLAAIRAALHAAA